MSCQDVDRVPRERSSPLYLCFSIGELLIADEVSAENVGLKGQGCRCQAIGGFVFTKTNGEIHKEKRCRQLCLFHSAEEWEDTNSSVSCSSGGHLPMAAGRRRKEEMSDCWP